MADMSITAANVVAGSDADILAPTLAGETIAAGKAVTKLSTTKKWMLSDSNSATAELRTPGGFALNSAALNQPLVVGRFYHADDRPPLHHDGEVLFEHRVPDGTLNQLRFTDDGSIFIQRDVTKPEDNTEAK